MERNRENKEEVILTESAKLFHRKGYSATTMEEIAAAVGLLKASLYHYFESKEEIYYKLTKPPLEVGVNLLCEIVESDLTPREKLRKAFETHLQVIDRYSPRSPMLFRLSEQDLSCVSNKTREEMALLMDRYDHLWREIIAEGVSAGQFRTDLNIKLITYAILGMCNFTFRWYKKGDALAMAQVTEQYIALLGSGLFVNGAPDTPRKPLRKVSRCKSGANPKNLER